MSFGGAFQRAGIYKESVGEKEKKEFRNFIKKNIEDYVDKQYTAGKLTTQQHCNNIRDICSNVSDRWKHILKQGRLKIGVCQKLFNLYLKYLWCINVIKQPPNCPIDRIIMSLFRNLNMINWTEIDNINDYNRIVTEISKRAKKEGMSIAEWELSRFRRRSSPQTE